MATNIKSVLDNVKKIYMTDSVLESLLDYERVLDELDLYTFTQHDLGEEIHSISATEIRAKLRAEGKL